MTWVPKSRAGHYIRAKLGAPGQQPVSVMSFWRRIEQGQYRYDQSADFSPMTLVLTQTGNAVQVNTTRRATVKRQNDTVERWIDFKLYDVAIGDDVYHGPYHWQECSEYSCTWSTGGLPEAGHTYLVHLGDLWSNPVTFVAPAPPAPSQSAGGQNPSQADSQTCSCDPVNTATGEFFDTVADLSLPGTGPELGVTRTYSTTRASNDGPLGYGWSLNYGASLEFSGSPAAPTAVIVHQENGSTVTFFSDSKGGYAAPSTVLASLAKGPDGAWTFTRRDQSSMQFDQNGQLVAQRDLYGNALTFTHDAQGRLTSATGSGGRTLTYAWNGTRLSAVSDSAGRSVQYRYDTDGQLSAVTAVDDAVTGYDYDTAHRLVLTRRPGGSYLRNTYDPQGRVTRQTDALGQATNIAYSGSGAYTSTTVTGPDGAVTISEYTNGYLSRRTLAAGTPDAQVWKYTVDATGNTTKITDPKTNTISSEFDARGNRTQQTDPATGKNTTWTYNAFNQVTSVTDPMGNVETKTYDAKGNLVLTTSPDGRLQKWTYNPDGTMDTSTAPADTITTYTYDPAGRPTGSTTAGRSTSVTYNAAGFAVSTTDAGQHTTRRAYDAAGRLLTITDPAGRTTRHTYNEAGNRTQTTDPAGRTTSVSYDLLDRAVATTDPTGAITSTTYTPGGQVASVTDPLGQTSTREYNKLGLLTKATDPKQRSIKYGYDADGRPTTTELPSGAIAKTDYDAAGRVTARTEARKADGREKVTVYTYDDAGRLTETKDPLLRKTSRTYYADGQLKRETADDLSYVEYTYDANGRIKTLANPDPDHKRTSFEYNSLGQRTKRTLPGGVVTQYNYDDAGRPTRTVQPDTSTITTVYNDAGDMTGIDYSDPATADISYTYDPAGRRDTMTDGTGTTRYTYDPAGRLTAAADPTGTVGYTYDPAGRLTALTYPGGNTVTYGYDQASQMTSATDWAGRTTTFTWTDDGQQRTQTTPDGTTSTADYDTAGRTTSIKQTTAGGATLDTFAYTYDDAGQMQTGDGNTYTFGKTGKLAGVTGPTTTGTYATTPAGSLTGTPDGTTLTYNPAEQLTTTTKAGTAQANFTYDPDGNRTSTTTPAGAGNPAGTTTYRYNSPGSLTGVTTSTSNIGYTIDGGGLRKSRTKQGVTNTFTWATISSLPLLLTDGTHRYLHGPGLTPYAQIDNAGTIQYLHTDNLGSVRRITDTAGTTTGTTTYDPYGKRTGHTGSADSRIGYTGAWTDPDTGLVYLRARDYDPTTGQFLTLDPAIDNTGQAYAYARNNPIQNTDPAGLCASCSFMENLVLNHGPSEDTLTTGVIGGVVSFFEGVGDAASLGLTAHAREALSPGANCFVKTDSWTYRAGEITTYLMPAGGAIKGAYAAYKGIRAARTIAAGADGAANVANGSRLAADLGRQQAGSIFNPSGGLKREVIDSSEKIMLGENMNSAYVRRTLTADGSKLADWGKYSARGHGPDGKHYDVHFYYNSRTRAVNYDFDYKVKLGGQDNGPAARPALPNMIDRSGW
ncbi:RHS repeat-associated core domain-containing protein [Actinoplanes sp. NPDC089786]|uniref:RHS repeat-associated core domain-containing protein n=1 Tax=Actinoplanes sp. NPDC089786 TaxID=3155185 RepID=UPI00342DAFF3